MPHTAKASHFLQKKTHKRIEFIVHRPFPDSLLRLKVFALLIKKKGTVRNYYLPAGQYSRVILLNFLIAAAFLEI